MVRFLWNATGKPEPATSQNPFKKDVREGSYYYKALLWAYEKGIGVGTGAKMFGPDEICTHAQIVTLLYHYMER